MAVEPRLNPIIVVVAIPTTGAGTGDTFSFYTAEFAGQILGGYVTNSATLASDTSHYTTVTLQKGSTVAFTTSNNGTAITADVPRAMTKAGTDADCIFAAGDVLKFVKADTGNGQALTTPCFLTAVLMQSSISPED